MISTTVSRNNYGGPGAGPFPFSYKIFAYADLLVTRRATTGTETTLVYGPDFSSAGVGVEAGGSITLTVPLLSGETLSVRRAPALLQKTSLQNQSSYYGSTHETTFDTLVMQLQAQKDVSDRSLGMSESYDPATITGLKLTAGAAGTVLGGITPTQLGNLTPAGGAGYIIPVLPGQGRTVSSLTQY